VIVDRRHENVVAASAARVGSSPSPTTTVRIV
jgi:hypothetical protein